MDSEAFPDSFSMSKYIPYFASRGNFTGEICKLSSNGWILYDEEQNDEYLHQYMENLEHDFASIHPVFKTLVSSAHTIGSYDSIIEW